MPYKGWRLTSIPVEMVEHIQKVTDAKPDLGYRSIVDATHHHLKELSKSPLER